MMPAMQHYLWKTHGMQWAALYIQDSRMYWASMCFDMPHKQAIPEAAAAGEPTPPNPAIILELSKLLA